jgi:hypothetical protein
VKKPKVLLFDVETAPILAYCWSIWDQNIGLNQIKSDWYVIAWCAKWLGDTKVMYQDQRKAKNIEDDSNLLEGIWKLLDEADVVITQNGKHFDQKKLNARFVLNGYQPPNHYKHIDTKEIASKRFGFTSNKLEYMTDKLCTKYKKLKHEKFPGFELWAECLKGNKQAWDEMEKYNKHDVLALEELYNKLAPWDSTVNFNLYHDDIDNICSCGSTQFHKRGFIYTAVSKFQCYRCSRCGKELRGRINQFTQVKRASLRVGIK